MKTSVTRLLFVSSDKFPPFRVDVGVLFGEELTRRYVEVDWLLQSDAECEHSYETEFSGGRAWIGATDLGSGRLARLRKHVLSIENDLKILGLVRSAQYDFVQVRNKFFAAIIAIVACTGKKTRPIYWMSFPYAESSLYEARIGTARYPLFYVLRGVVFSFLLYRVILPRMLHVFVQSDQMKRDVVAKGIPPERITPVPMGVQLALVPYGELSHGQRGGEIRILYLGTLNRVRRLDFLIRSFAMVKRKYSRAVLELVGKGDDPLDHELLINEARNLGVQESVRFIGFLPMVEGWEYVRKAYVCVSPYFPTPILNSTSPTKLVEYMAMGRPVVANDHPDQRTVIDESGGGICVPWDESAFAKAIGQLIENPTMAAEMGRKGRKYVEVHRDYPVIADRVAKIYESLRAPPG